MPRGIAEGNEVKGRVEQQADASKRLVGVSKYLLLWRNLHVSISLTLHAIRRPNNIIVLP